MNILTILDQEFEISSATLKQSDLGDRKVIWDLMIRTNRKESAWGSSAPNIRCEGMRARWGKVETLQGETIEIPTAYDNDTHEYLFTMYVNDHADVFASKISFGTVENNRIPIKWAGKCNVHWDEKYGTNLPFDLETELDLVLK